MMFFRRRRSQSFHVIEKNGAFYVEQGQDYDKDLYETDSDDDDTSNIGSDSISHCDDEKEDITEAPPPKDQIEMNVSIEANTAMNSSSMSFTEEHIEARPEIYQQKIVCVEAGPQCSVNQTTTSEASNNLIDTAIIPCTLKPVKANVGNDMGPVSFEDKKIILNLAAQHDRVDIINSILQPNFPEEEDNIAFLQLLLNNRIHHSKSVHFTEQNRSIPFLPPLHLAVASSAVHAATCLLRMGADPSFRPSIPSDWTGPLGLDPTDWHIFDGLTAWELVFGPGSAMDDSIDTTHPKGRDIIMKNKPWFSWSSGDADHGAAEYLHTRSYVKISQSKLEGIKHAFAAEALRAIGSDDMCRLEELLDSGLDSGPHATRIEMGGKDLLGWCLEMDANNCADLIKNRMKCETIVSCNKTSAVEFDHDNQSVSSTSKELSTFALKKKLEESNALLIALSSILDNLADEVSITRELLFENNSHAALLTQVRSLKMLRDQKDDDIEQWEQIVKDQNAELETLSISARTDYEWEETSRTQLVEKYSSKTTHELDLEEDTDLGIKLVASENKVRKLRFSIEDLAAENSRNLLRLEQMGLIGAVKLARSLKDEVRERDEKLQQLKRHEAELKAQIEYMHSRMNAETIKIEESSAMGHSLTTQVNEVGRDDISSKRNRLVREDPSVPVPETADDAFAEAETLEEDSTFDSFETVENHPAHGEDAALKRNETAIILRQNYYLPSKLWDLIMRIVGLGRDAARRTFQDNQGMEIPRIMIV